jgi:3-dehydroquinate synthase
MTIPAGENAKSLTVFADLLERMKRAGVTRADCLLALGGGVVGDLAGFAAACYMRGLPFAQIPTSLLAQVDSSVGGKTAVNLPGGKNYCGVFNQPRAVYIDPAVLASLPAEELRNGLAEVVKYGVIADADFFAYLQENVEPILRLDGEALSRIIERSCAIKAEVVEKDEREGGLRRILNYGHTVGHGVEDHFRYLIPHGLAVAYGMRAVARMAVRMGLLPESEEMRQNALLDAFGLAVEPLDFDPEAVLARMRGDKKATDKAIVFILPTAIGSVVIRDDVPEEVVMEGLAAIRKG